MYYCLDCKTNGYHLSQLLVDQINEKIITRGFFF
jgi:hypothetical protein